MPKASTRFRNRKINFKTRIGIRIGALEAPSDHEDEDGFHFEDDRGVGSSTGIDDKDRHHVETGVDKDEEGEHHLQVVINASAAALSRHGGAEPRSALAQAQGKALEPSIPIPDAAGIVEPEVYDALYKRDHPFALPSTYIRFSDTVEEANGNVAYCMDEEDEAWLENFNAGPPSTSTSANGAETSSSSLNGAASVNGQANDAGRGRRGSPRKGKEREKASSPAKEEPPLGPGKLDEDDFEVLMDLFEKVTDETVPGLHLDTSRLPSLSDFEGSLSDATINVRLPSIKIFAQFVYSHWKERRLKRGGKPIMPQLDFDETNDNNSYVCFRRREIKTVRKTRRTDAQNLDRLVRLRADLVAAKDLLAKALERERTKRDLVETERAIFNGRCELRELKRRLGEGEGDDELLVGKREKKRKRTESGLDGIGPESSRLNPLLLSGLANSPIKIPVRIKSSVGGGPASPTIIAAELNALKERGAGLNRAIDREMHRKREADSGWEDWTDSAYQPLPLPMPVKMWRATAPVGREKDAPLGFEQREAVAIPGTVRAVFRRRVGRGGRVLIDRISPHLKRPSGHTQLAAFASAHLTLQAALAAGKQPTEIPPGPTEDDDRRRRNDDRWRYDDDARLDFPSVDDAPIVDDYQLGFSKRRAQLLQPEDLVYLDTDSDAWLAKAREWLDRPPDPEPPVVKVGRLPGRPANALAPPLGGVGMNGVGLPAGLGMPNRGAAQMPPGTSSAMHDQMLLAAQHANGLSQIRRAVPAAGLPSTQPHQPSPLGPQQGGQRTPGTNLTQQQQMQLAALGWQQQQAAQLQAAQAQAAAQAQGGAGAQNNFPAMANQIVANQMIQQQLNQQMAAQQSGLLARQQQHLQVNAQGGAAGMGVGMAGLPIGNATLARASLAAGLPINGMPNAGPRTGSSTSEQVARSPALAAQTGPSQLGSSPRPGSAASSQHYSPGTASDALPLIGGVQGPYGTGFPNGSSPALRHAKRPGSALSGTHQSPPAAHQGIPQPLVNGTAGSPPPPHAAALNAQQQQAQLQALQAALQAKGVAGLNGLPNGMVHAAMNGMYAGYGGHQG